MGFFEVRGAVWGGASEEEGSGEVVELARAAEGDHGFIKVAAGVVAGSGGGSGRGVCAAEGDVVESDVEEPVVALRNG